MAGLNVFETIRSTTRRIEPFHSQFLADALDASRDGDRSLFDGFWQLAAPPDWPVPQKAAVKTELDVGNGRRIDLCIQDEERCRILGIEVKTSCISRKPGQLEAYEQGLVHNNPDFDIAIAYLTPFNRERAGDHGGMLGTVQLFQAFAEASSRAGQHVSWLDVAELSWDGRAIWRDHQTYVRKRIAPREKLRANVTGNRRFNTLFGEEAAGAFWEALAELGVLKDETGARIELGNFAPVPRARAGVRDSHRRWRWRIETQATGQIPARSGSDSFRRLAPTFTRNCSGWPRFLNVWIEGRNDCGIAKAGGKHHPSVASAYCHLLESLSRTGACVWTLAVAILLGRTSSRPLTIGSAGAALHFEFNQTLGGVADQVAQELVVGVLGESEIRTNTAALPAAYA